MDKTERFLENPKPVYWDNEKKMFYWIEWIETGNNDIPKKHYIKLSNPQNKG